MKYAITPDKKIHQVTDEKKFYRYYPDAQDVTMLEGIYDRYMKQESKERILNCAKATAVCIKQTGLPVVVVIGNEEYAREYIKNETSMPIEQFCFVTTNVVVYDFKEVSN